MKFLGLDIRRIKNNDKSLPIPTSNYTPDNVISGGLLWRVGMSPSQLLSNTTVLACTELIADSIAMLPCNVYKKTANGRERDDSPSISYVLRRSPNYLDTPFSFKQTILMHLLLEGNAFIFIDRWPDFNVKRLTPLYPSKVKNKFDDKGDVYYLYEYNGKTYKYNNDQILHIPAYKLGGVRGLSPIEYAHHAAKLGLDLDSYTADSFDGGIQAKIKVGVPVEEKNWKEEDTKKLNDRIKDELTGADSRKKALILTKGVTADALNLATNADSQLNDTRVFSEKEIAKIYRVPMMMLGKDDAKFTNNEQLNTFFLQHTLTPWLVRIQERLDWLLNWPLSEDHYIEFDADAMLRADYNSRINGFIRGIQGGIYTPNQVFDMENLPRTSESWGDQHFMPVNISTVDKIAAAPLSSAQDTTKTTNSGATNEE